MDQLVKREKGEGDVEEFECIRFGGIVRYHTRNGRLCMLLCVRENELSNKKMGSDLFMIGFDNP